MCHQVSLPRTKQSRFHIGVGLVVAAIIVAAGAFLIEAFAENGGWLVKIAKAMIAGFNVIGGIWASIEALKKIFE